MRTRRHAQRRKKRRDYTLAFAAFAAFGLAVMLAHVWAIIALTGIPAAFAAGWLTARRHYRDRQKPARTQPVTGPSPELSPWPGARTGPLTGITREPASRQKLLTDPRSGASPLTRWE